MALVPKTMRTLQDRSESDSDVEIDFDHSGPEEASGWNESLDIDRYLKNKDVDGKLKSKLIRKANMLVRLSSVIFRYKIPFERIDTPSGWTHKASCPFPDHRDSDPSFGYNSKDDRFHCFGCDRSGGTVQFLSAMQKRPQYEIAKQLLATVTSSEQVISDLDESETSKIDKVLFDFASKVHDFIAAQKFSSNAVEFVEKLSWNLDMYVAQHAMDGTIDPEALAVRVEKLLGHLESYGR